MRDECFIRGKVPMTKSEVRAIALSKLQIKKDSVVYDVGAGTGSVAVEAALWAEYGQVYAFEKNPGACDLIRQNAARFGCRNINVVSGTAPDTIAGFPPADCAFIGGSGGTAEAVLNRLLKVNPAMRIVLSAITLETFNQIVNYLQTYNKAAEIIQVQISYAEAAGRYRLMKARNPVWLVTIPEDKSE